MFVKNATGKKRLEIRLIPQLLETEYLFMFSHTTGRYRGMVIYQGNLLSTVKLMPGFSNTRDHAMAHTLKYASCSIKPWRSNQAGIMMRSQLFDKVEQVVSIL